MKYGDIVKFKNQVGSLVGGEDRDFYFLPAGYGSYSFDELNIITDKDIKECSHEEKVEFLKKEFKWGEILKVHELGEYIIFEFKRIIDDIEEILFKPYINFESIPQSFITLERSVISAYCIQTQREYDDRVIRYFSKMLGE